MLQPLQNAAFPPGLIHGVKDVSPAADQHRQRNLPVREANVGEYSEHEQLEGSQRWPSHR